MKLLAATGNPHKLEEIRRILSHLGVEVLSPRDVGINISVEENGDTFSQNAYLKAVAYHKASGMAVIADDSGLCVDALGGRPGVHSARYQGEGSSYQVKINALLAELKDIPQDKRIARFVSSICCIMENGRFITCDGFCEGYIGFSPSGAGGFGYDPIFYIGNKSMAQLSDKEKDAVSHRGNALEIFAKLLKSVLEDKSKQVPHISVFGTSVRYYEVSCEFGHHLNSGGQT